MKHYYIADPNAEKGFIEITEEEFNAIIGTEETRPYASKVYRGELSIEEVPEDIRETVQAIVDAKIARFGEYAKQEISANELNNMIEEVL
jgi:hypothetical protein